MARSMNGLIYEIVDIPESFEIGRLKDFCKKIIREIESVESIRSPINSEKDFDDLEERQEKQIFQDETINKRDEDESDVICSNFDEKKINSKPTFIFHLDTYSNNELTSNTLKLFDDIFQNISYEVKLPKNQEKNKNECQFGQNRKEYNDTKPKIKRNKLTRKRIRKSFIHDN